MAALSSLSTASTCRSAPCRVCSTPRGIPYLEARSYRILRCRRCGLWYVDPQPTSEELSTFYSSYDDREQWREREEHFNRGVRKAILRFERGGAVLDVGSGSGNFLACMREKGFSVFGVEPSKTGSEYARAVHGIETFHGMVEDYLASGLTRTFAVVTLLNVLEHLTDPAKALLELRQRMAPNGLLVVVVPDARFHDVLGRIRSRLRISDPYWLNQPTSFLSGFKLPDHLCSFQPQTISLLLERCGFRAEFLQNAPIVFNSGLSRNLGKLLVRSVLQSLYYITFRRLLFGYSTLVIARKTARELGSR